MDKTLRRNTLILVGSLAAILLLYVIVYWLPQRRRSANMRGEIQQKREAIENCKKQSNQLPSLKGELALLETYNRTGAERIPPAMNVKEFLAAVHSLGQREDVNVANMTRGITTEFAGLQQQPINLTLVGKFNSIVHLMYELETMNRIIELSDLDIRSLDKTATQDDMLEVKLAVRLYARPPKLPPPTQNNG